MRRLILKLVNSATAFTLIELIVALTIFSVIAAGLGATFLSGMKLWNKANESASAGKADFFLEVFAGDLSQSLGISQVGFSGTKEVLSFPALAAGRAVKITYSFDPQGKKLFRRVFSLNNALSEEKDVQPSKEESLDVDSCEFSYFSYDDKKEEYSWVQAWEKKSVFLGVRTKITYEGKELARTVFIPIS